VRFTSRLRLEPTCADHAEDLWRVHQDDTVAEWYAGAWSPEQARAFAATCQQAWISSGVSKWMAYERDTGSLVGRGGLSGLSSDDPVTDQIAALTDGDSWRGQRLELGWALVGAYRGRGYAAEIGQEGVAFAEESLGAARVISFTEVHNVASRRVMERVGMRYIGEVIAGGLIEGTAGVHDNAHFAAHIYDCAHPR
jgi:RimJ/RimL family protein N-acetyltransferase